jgi:hypothetical protein
VKSLRFIIGRQGTLFKVAQLSFGKNDQSIYITPYVPAGGTGYVGQMKIPAPGQSGTWDYSRQASGTPVRVTLHESGRCHATAGGSSTPPVFGRPLQHDSRAHVATIVCFDLTGLPTIRQPRGGSTPDVLLLATDAEWTSLHIPLYVCPDPQSAAVAWMKMSVTMTRDNSTPLILGIGGRTGPESAEGLGSGVLVLAGWGPGNDDRPLTGIYGVTSPVALQRGESEETSPNITEVRGSQPLPTRNSSS